MSLREINYRTKSAILILLILGFIVPLSATSIVSFGSQNGCDFPAIYNFGDSNSDTGSESAVFGRAPPPNGMTFFGEPSGRYSDGRLVVDFLASELGLPYLSSFLDSLHTSYRHGANFAASGATIEDATGRSIDAGFSPISLKRQLSQFDQFKNRSIELYLQGKTDGLPRPEDFPKALYMFDIGQNDLHYHLMSSALNEVLVSLPVLIEQTALAMQNLYEHGARAFWIHNTGPLGCLPDLLETFPLQLEDTDQIGCIKSVNGVAQEFNKQLMAKVTELRFELNDAAFTYVDIYSAKYKLFLDGSNEGFVDPHGYCCKRLDDPNLRCWDVNTVNITSVYTSSCSNPSRYISWDSIHFTESANKWVANQILDGSLSDPPLPITAACQTATVSDFFTVDSL